MHGSTVGGIETVIGMQMSTEMKQQKANRIIDIIIVF